MNIYKLLSNAGELVTRQWRATQPPEHDKILYLVQDAGFYIWRTGQIYRFEDYLERTATDRAVAIEASMRVEESEDIRRAVQLLFQMRDALPSKKEKRLAQVVIDRFGFITSMGQRDDFSDYLKTFNSAPPPVIATSTRVMKPKRG